MVEKLKEYFKTRGIGFYFTLVVVILSFIGVIIYVVAFNNDTWVSYMHWSVILFLSLSIIFGAGLSIFNVTSSWAPAAATLFNFLSFLMFMRYGYMYFSQIFYSGITISLIFQMYYGYLASLILYILALGLGIAAISLKQYKKVENQEKIVGVME